MEYRVSTVNNEDGTTEIYLVGIEHWDDFDLLLGLLQQENDCKILNNQELVYMRKAELVKNGIRFNLVHDDMLGNYLHTNKKEYVPLLEQLANTLISSIKTKLADI